MNSHHYYHVVSQSEHIYRIHSSENVYMDLFVGTKKALLLDTGYGFGNLRETVQSITHLPLIIVNTHGHYDHVNGNYQFSDRPIYMHEKDWNAWEFYSQEKNRRNTLERARHTKNSWNSHTYINIVPDDIDEEAYIHTAPIHLHSLKEGMVFDLGGITLKVIEVPGHTCGSCALLHLETKDLYIGDAANAHLVLTVFNAPIDIYKETLHKLKHLDFIRMRPSHESDWIPKAMIDDFLDCVCKPDPQNYITVSSPARPDQIDYMYIRHGYTATDTNKPGFSSFIVHEKL